MKNWKKTRSAAYSLALVCLLGIAGCGSNKKEEQAAVTPGVEGSDSASAKTSSTSAQSNSTDSGRQASAPPRGRRGNAGRSVAGGSPSTESSPRGNGSRGASGGNNAGGRSGPEPQGQDPQAANSQAPTSQSSTSQSSNVQQSDGSPPEPLSWNDAGSFDEISRTKGFYPRRTFDAAVLQRNGIRHIQGERLDLYTDLPSSPALDELPQVFEQAHKAWCEYFGIDASTDSAWRMNGFVMGDRKKFVDSGLLPADLPAFENAFCRDFEFWMDEKSSDYYRRHLALHEGTHGFMLTHISGNYPEWFFEGMAELLGTHLLSDGDLRLGYFPIEQREVPMWGRVGLVREGFRAGRIFPWKQLVSNGIARTEDETEFYAWVWAWCAYMHGNEPLRARFDKLFELRLEADFSTALARKYADEWATINDNWQVFVSEIDYAYDFERNAIRFVPGIPVPGGTTEFSVAADAGWQSTGLKFEKGKTYEVIATGRYVMHRDTSVQPPAVWESEPQGISIEYFNGSPIGTLQAAIVPDERDPAAVSPFLNAVPLGNGGTDTASSSGTLYLRINDHPAKRADNSGSAEVTIREAPAGD